MPRCPKLNMLSFPNSITNISIFEQRRSTQSAIQKLPKTSVESVDTNMMVFVKINVNAISKLAPFLKMMTVPRRRVRRLPSLSHSLHGLRMFLNNFVTISVDFENKRQADASTNSCSNQIKLKCGTNCVSFVVKKVVQGYPNPPPKNERLEPEAIATAETHRKPTCETPDARRGQRGRKRRFEARADDGRTKKTMDSFFLHWEVMFTKKPSETKKWCCCFFPGGWEQKQKKS